MQELGGVMERSTFIIELRKLLNPKCVRALLYTRCKPKLYIAFAHAR